MAGLNGQELQIGSYDTERYPFKSAVVRAAFEQYRPLDWESPDEADSLEYLHESHAWLGQMGVAVDDPTIVHTRETDQTARYYRDLYMLLTHHSRPAFKFAYWDFLEDEIQPQFDEPIVYQTMPTLRAHMPGNVAVGEYHVDSKYGHPKEAVNFWVPFTNAHDTNTLHVQTSEDTEPQPIDVAYGEYVAFDGVNLPHGNELNTTGRTRVSMDLRVIPESKFIPSSDAAINTGLKFDIGEGGYYSLLTPENMAQQRAELEYLAAPALEWEARIKASREPAGQQKWKYADHAWAENVKRVWRIATRAPSLNK